MTTLIGGLCALGLAAGAIGGDDPMPQAPPDLREAAEAVLRDAGLSARVGNVYLLGEDIELRDKRRLARRIRTEIDREWVEVTRWVVTKHLDIEHRSISNGGVEKKEVKEMELSERGTRLAENLQSLQSQIRRESGRIAQSYRSLSRSPEVVAALKDLNRGRRLKLALGPLATSQGRVAQSYLKDRGILSDRGSYYLAEERAFCRDVAAAQILQRQMAAGGRALDGKREELAQAVRDLEARREAIRERLESLSKDPELREALEIIGSVTAQDAGLDLEKGQAVALGHAPRYPIASESVELLKGWLRDREGR